MRRPRRATDPTFPTHVPENRDRPRPPNSPANLHNSRATSAAGLPPEPPRGPRHANDLTADLHREPPQRPRRTTARTWPLARGRGDGLPPLRLPLARGRLHVAAGTCPRRRPAAAAVRPSSSPSPRRVLAVALCPLPSHHRLTQCVRRPASPPNLHDDLDTPPTFATDLRENDGRPPPSSLRDGRDETDRPPPQTSVANAVTSARTVTCDRPPPPVVACSFAGP